MKVVTLGDYAEAKRIVAEKSTWYWDKVPCWAVMSAFEHEGETLHDGTYDEFIQIKKRYKCEQ